MLEYYYAQAKLRDSQSPSRERDAAHRREAELFIEHVRRLRLSSIFRPAGERAVQAPAKLLWT